MTPIPLSLYIHFPWCIHKCPYCDFNSHKAPQSLDEERYIDALLKDLEQELPAVWGRPLHTVFIGGGTPSLMSGKGMHRLIKGLNTRLPMRPGMEITMEANPGTFEQQRFTAFREAGISRLSIGIQSFNAAHLKTLERVHNAQEAHRAAEIALKAGFDNFNLDLMYGLPEQSHQQALEDLEQAISHKPTHMSWYQLTIEPNTLFHNKPPVLPDPDSIADMQDAGVNLLNGHGYEQYEVSAYAQPKRQCNHNINYWEFGDYIGIGAGAHGKITVGETITRTLKHKHPERYMESCLDDKALPLSSSSQLSKKDLAFEFMLNALRLKAGVDRDLFAQRTFMTEDHLVDGLKQAIQKGLLEESTTHLKLSERGWHFLNEAVECFL